MKLKRGRVKVVVMGMGAVALLPLLSACQNVQTFSSQCAYIIQNGYFDAHHVKTILLPGEHSNHNNSTVRYVYCNARNFRVQPGGDDANVTEITAKTAPSSNGDGTPVDVQLEAYFSLNQNKSALLDFLPFCEKYNCFSPKDTASNSSENNSSSTGWNNMLAENFPNAINRATRQAMLAFPPNVWNDTSKWNAVSDAISADFAQQLQIQDSSPNNEPFFCDQGATPTSCKPVRFAIESIDPSDPQIRTIYNQQVEQQQEQLLAAQQAKTNAAQLKAAEKKYGKNAATVLGILDEIAACKNDASQCIVSVGQNATPTVSAGR